MPVTPPRNLRTCRVLRTLANYANKLNCRLIWKSTCKQISLGCARERRLGWCRSAASRAIAGILSSPAIALAAGPAAHHQRTKHIAGKYHFQRQLLLNGVVRYQHQDTAVQAADILTKALSRKLHKRHRDVLLGRQPLKIISKELPHSHKQYVRLHNEQLSSKSKQVRLSQQLKDSELHS